MKIIGSSHRTNTNGHYYSKTVLSTLTEHGIPSHLTGNGFHQENKWGHREGGGKRGAFDLLLLRMQICAVTVGVRIEVPQTKQNTHTQTNKNDK